MEQKEQWIFILWRACKSIRESKIVIIIKANIGRDMRALKETTSFWMHRFDGKIQFLCGFSSQNFIEFPSFSLILIKFWSIF